MSHTLSDSYPTLHQNLLEAEAAREAFLQRCSDLAELLQQYFQQEEKALRLLHSLYTKLAEQINVLSTRQLLSSALASNCQFFIDICMPPFTRRALESAPTSPELARQLRSGVVDYLVEESSEWISKLEKNALQLAQQKLEQSEEADLARLLTRCFELSLSLKPQEAEQLNQGVVKYRQRQENAIANLPYTAPGLLPRGFDEEDGLAKDLDWFRAFKREAAESLVADKASRQLLQLARKAQHAEPPEFNGLFYPVLGGSEEEAELEWPLYDEAEEAEWVPVHDLRYAPGTPVQITIEHYPNEQLFPKLHTKGWQGRVEHAYTDGLNIRYVINLDSLTLQQLPEDYLKDACEEMMHPNVTRFEFGEDEIAPAQARDTEAEAITAQRSVCHRYFWGDIEADTQAARIHRILMQQPTQSDLDNWLRYFREEVQYPFPALAEGLVLQQLPRGTKVEVVGIEGIDEEGLGLIASVKKGRAIISYPLMELAPMSEEATEENRPLRDYRYWADFLLL